MARALGAPDLLPFDGHVAAAVEARVHIYNVFFKRHGERERFEGRARLIGIVDGLAAPLLVAKVRGVFDDLLLRHAGGEKIVVDHAGIIQVVGRERGHRQHRAGVDVHDDARRALAGAEACLKLLHALFKVVLDGGIERGLQVAAVFRVEILVVLVEHGAAVAVARGDDHAALAGQHIVVGCLKAHRAAVIVGKADDLRCERPLGIAAFARRAQENSLQVILVDEFPHLVCKLVVRLFLELFVLRVRFFHLFEDVPGVHIQDLGKTVCDQVLILLVFHDLLGREEDRLRRGGHGENGAVAVVDGAAARVHGGAQRLLAHGDGLELLVLGDLPVVELCKEQHEGQHAEHAEQQQRSRLNDAVCAARGFGASSLLGLCHSRSSSLKTEKE